MKDSSAIAIDVDPIAFLIGEVKSAILMKVLHLIRPICICMHYNFIHLSAGFNQIPGQDMGAEAGFVQGLNRQETVLQGPFWHGTAPE